MGAQRARFEGAHGWRAGFNAAAAMNVQGEEIVAPVDTVMFCLSKALGAPVGSMLAGESSLIARGRLYRKRLGGGMRAFALLCALDSHPGDVSSVPLVCCS